MINVGVIHFYREEKYAQCLSQNDDRTQPKTLTQYSQQQMQTNPSYFTYSIEKSIYLDAYIV